LEEVRRALSLITEAQRQAIVLRLVVGLSLEETARAMGKSLGAVKALQHGGLRALRRHLRIEEAPVG
jgi:RNA polymerase sigma-70 factor (ECF subfamily)